MPAGMFNPFEFDTIVSSKTCMHISVGFCVVARSTVMGNARALNRRTSNSTDSCAFLLLKVKPESGETIGHIKTL